MPSVAASLSPRSALPSTRTPSPLGLSKGAPPRISNKIRTGIAKLNSEITKERDLGEGFCIGHSFFCPADHEKPNDQWYSEIIDSEIKPLLKEYFESPDRVETLTKELLQ